MHFCSKETSSKRLKRAKGSAKALGLTWFDVEQSTIVVVCLSFQLLKELQTRLALFVNHTFNLFLITMMTKHERSTSANFRNDTCTLLLGWQMRHTRLPSHHSTYRRYLLAQFADISPNRGGCLSVDQQGSFHQRPQHRIKQRLNTSQPARN